jgi:hypothetical protein
MGAFIGYGDTGVWASNGERDAFLDWFAENRCVFGDSRWEYCKSDEQRWSGRCIDLADLLPSGTPLALTADEISDVARRFSSQMVRLLSIIDAITRGEWSHQVDSKAAVGWRLA